MATRAKKCHEGSCGPCGLCHQSQRKYEHPVRWTEEDYILLVKVDGSPVQREACICYSCTKQFKRNKENLKFQPRWKCTLPKEKIKCSIDKCDNRVHKHTKLASVEAIEERLEDKAVSFTVDEKQVSVGLCQVHCNALYSRLNPTHSCDSCKARPHAGQVFNRHCPSPEVVNTYLRLVINEHNQLSPDSLICTECYRHFSDIIKNIKGESIQQFNRDLIEELNKQDKHELMTIISSLTAQAQALRQSTVTDLFEFAVLQVGILFGELMVAGGATLLPHLYDKFVSIVQNRAQTLHIALGSENIPTRKWLLSKLHSYYENKIEVQCRQRRYGSVLFHRKCDLVHTLSTVLGKGCNPYIIDHKTGNTESVGEQSSSELCSPTLYGATNDDRM